MGLGLFLVTVCVTILFLIYNGNYDLKTYFILELNSGNTILFSSQDKDFLWKAKMEVIKCFNNRNTQCIINFSDCTISHSQIGEDNFMDNKEAHYDK